MFSYQHSTVLAVKKKIKAFLNFIKEDVNPIWDTNDRANWLWPVGQHLLEVFPVVGLLAKKADFKPFLNIAEVDAIFDVPLEMFLKVGWYYCF